MGGIFILILYIILGVIIGAWLFEDCRPLKRIWLGGVIGMMLMMWSHVPFSFFMGFTVWSHMLGLVFSAAICTVIVFLKSGGKTHSIDGRGIAGRWLVPLNKNEVIMAVSVTTLMLVSVVLLFNHILVEIDGAYYTGQCTYGDMNMHLGFISSIARQGMFPPTYSIMAGEPLNYPFLCDSISSSMMLFGASLRCAYIAPMIFAFMWVYTGCWYIAEAILERVGRVWLAFTLFFLDGGFGIIYFLDNLKGEDKSNFTRIFTAFYETPTNYVNSDRYVLAANGSDFVAVKGYSNIRWTNIIADMLLPQRATLFGWMCLFAVLYLLYMAVFKDKKQYFIIAGIMGGLLPMIHTHSYFALGLIAICWIIYSCVKKRFNKEIIMSWLSFGAPALALSVPQLLKWTFNAVGESFVRYTFNWVNSDGTDNWLWFWVKNVGLAFILLPTAFIHADREKKFMYSGALLIFAISEFIVFQPNTYDNIKLFFIWYLYTVILVAELLADGFNKLKGIKGRSIIAGILLVAMTVSGVLTIAREAVSGTYDKETGRYAYLLYSKKHVDSAKFIEENTSPDAVFLCWNNHNNSIASLTGRNIYCGAGTFLYFHGVGYQSREALMKKMLSDEKVFEENKEEAGIDYVYIADYERGNLGGSLIEDYFDNNYKLIYDCDGVKIFDVR